MAFAVIRSTPVNREAGAPSARDTLTGIAQRAGIALSPSAVPSGEAGLFLTLPAGTPPRPGSGGQLWRLIGVVTRRFAPKDTNGYRSAALRVWDVQSGVCEASTEPRSVFLVVLVGAAFDRWFSHMLPRVVLAIGPASGTPDVTALPPPASGGATAAAAAMTHGSATAPEIKIVVTNPADIVTLGLSDNVASCGAKIGNRNDASTPMCDVFINRQRTPACARHLVQAVKQQNADSVATQKLDRAREQQQRVQSITAEQKQQQQSQQQSQQQQQQRQLTPQQQQQQFLIQQLRNPSVAGSPNGAIAAANSAILMNASSNGGGGNGNGNVRNNINNAPPGAVPSSLLPNAVLAAAGVSLVARKSATQQQQQQKKQMTAADIAANNARAIMSVQRNVATGQVVAHHNHQTQMHHQMYGTAASGGGGGGGGAGGGAFSSPSSSALRGSPLFSQIPDSVANLSQPQLGPGASLPTNTRKATPHDFHNPLAQKIQAGQVKQQQKQQSQQQIEQQQKLQMARYGFTTTASGGGGAGGAGGAGTNSSHSLVRPPTNSLVARTLQAAAVVSTTRRREREDEEREEAERQLVQKQLRAQQREQQGKDKPATAVAAASQQQQQQQQQAVQPKFLQEKTYHDANLDQLKPQRQQQQLKNQQLQQQQQQQRQNPALAQAPRDIRLDEQLHQLNSGTLIMPARTGGITLPHNSSSSSTSRAAAASGGGSGRFGQPQSLQQRQNQNRQQQQSQSQQQQQKPKLASRLGLDANFRQVASTATSRNEDLARQAQKEETTGQLDAIAQQGAIFDALNSIEEVATNAFFCETCERYTFQRPPVCSDQGHSVVRRRTMKRFYRCGQCKNGRVPALGESVPVQMPCLYCGASCWERVSAAGGPDGTTPELWTEAERQKEIRAAAASAGTNANG